MTSIPHWEGLLCVLSLTALAWGSLRCMASMRDRSHFDQIAGTIIIALSTILLVEQGVGYLGLLNSPLRYGCLLGTGIALAWRFQPVSVSIASKQDQGWGPIALVAAIGFLALLISAGKRAVTNPPYDTDSLYYRLVISGQMLQSGQINNVDAPFWFYPANSELLGHFLLRCVGNDSLIQWLNLFSLTLYLSGIIALALRLNGGVICSLSVAFLLGGSCSPILYQTFTQENDLLFGGSLIAALNFLLHWKRTGELKALVLSALAIGIVLGLKYSGIYYSAIWFLILGIALIGSSRNPLGRRAFLACIAGTLVLLLGGGWYLRNWILTGSPLYPQTLGIFHVDPDAGRAMEGLDVGPKSTIAYHLLSFHVIGLSGSAFLKQGGLLACIAIILLPFGIAAARRSIGGVGAGMLAVGAVFFGLGALISPLSAENVPGTLNQLWYGYTPIRYSLAFIGLCAALLPCLIRALEPIRHASLLFKSIAILGCASIVYPDMKTLSPAFMVSVGFSLCCYMLYSFWPTERPSRPILAIWPGPVARSAIGLVCGCCLGIVLLHVVAPAVYAVRQSNRAEYYGKNWSYREGSERKSDLYGWCDKNLHDSDILVDGTVPYPFFGTGFSNHVHVLELSWSLEHHPDKLHPVDGRRRYLVLARRNLDAMDPQSGQFSSAKSLIDMSPARYRPVFQDDFAVVYFVISLDALH